MPENDDFASWLRARAIAAGFDVDAARGGRTALAEEAGMSVTQIGRTLEGKTTPSVESQRGLARALHVPFSEMLIRSGFATPEDFSPSERPQPFVDLHQVAERLGVPPDKRKSFLSTIVALADLMANNALVEFSLRTDESVMARVAAPPKFTEPPEA